VKSVRTLRDFGGIVHRFWSNCYCWWKSRNHWLSFLEQSSFFDGRIH